MAVDLSIYPLVHTLLDYLSSIDRNGQEVAAIQVKSKTRTHTGDQTSLLVDQKTTCGVRLPFSGVGTRHRQIQTIVAGLVCEHVTSQTLERSRRSRLQFIAHERGVPQRGQGSQQSARQDGQDGAPRCPVLGGWIQLTCGKPFRVHIDID